MNFLRNSIFILSLTLNIGCDSESTCNSNDPENRDCTYNCITACSREEAANCKHDTSEGCFEHCKKTPEESLICQRAINDLFICASKYEFICTKEGYYEPTNLDICEEEINKLEYLGCG